jgi:aminoglycoside 6'-N-acetyltransferase I
MRDVFWQGMLENPSKEIDRFFEKQDACLDKGLEGALTKGLVEVFVLERTGGTLGGFIELSLRNHTEGSRARIVPYVEGWYVDEELRGRGNGKQLMQAAVRWAMEKGFDELASDALLENADGIAAHRALGFREVERLVCFMKQLPRCRGGCFGGPAGPAA